MLELRPVCECCGTPTPPAARAFICTYECTYCARCAAHHGKCPTCGGNLVQRPVRPPGKLAKDPASRTEVRAKRPCACPA